jgi:protein SCO1/2
LGAATGEHINSATPFHSGPVIRTPLAFVPYLIALAAVIGGLLSYAGDRTVGLVPGAAAAIGGPFTLVDQDGRTRTDKDFRGQYLLIYFGYTYCPDVCPTTLAVMGEAVRKLGPLAGRVRPVFITVDPGRDTPSVLKSYLHSFGPRFVGLTGSADAIVKVSREYSVYAARQPLQGGGYAMNHSNTIYLMGPNGKFVSYYDESIGPDALAAELRKRI